MKVTSPWIDEGSSKARLISVTPNAEEIVAHCARVSNPKNQENGDHIRLLRYCIKHGHLSIFEMANMTVEVITPLAIATQLLRHRSMTYQQLSLRYTTTQELKEILGKNGSLYYLPEEARVQDHRNRQNSIFADDAELTDSMQNTMMSVHNVAQMSYETLLSQGICKELARMVLPQSSLTRLYVNGTLRSWMTYLRVRDEPGVVQHEHVELARAIKTIFATEFPTIYQAFFHPDPDPDPLEVENEGMKAEIEELKAEIAVLKSTIRGTL